MIKYIKFWVLHVLLGFNLLINIIPVFTYGIIINMPDISPHTSILGDQIFALLCFLHIWVSILIFIVVGFIKYESEKGPQ